ncbi:MAG TPA: DUF6089 family protein [Ohtaekwangia sp.]|uniref:DUF6089 family protein n=1 Tax=Ohtaekwangia sp. TaxID=2066019 RepID=UPI002F938FC4
MKRLFWFLILTICLVPSLTEAQSFYSTRRNRNLLVGLGSGTANYFGEMVNPGKTGTLKFNIAANAEYYLHERISVRAGLTFFQISGDDAKANDDRQERNLSFKSSNIELSALGVINLSPIGLRFYQRSQLNFHAFAGIGLLYFNPKTEYQGKTYALQPLQTEGVKYSRITPVIPVGLGARIKINPFFNLLVEGGYRITFTDHLDDVSVRRYPDPATLKSDLSRALSDRRVEIGTQPANPTQVGVRGNPNKNDGYFLANITVQYYLPKEVFQSSQRKLYNKKRKYYYRRP